MGARGRLMDADLRLPTSRGLNIPIRSFPTETPSFRRSSAESVGDPQRKRWKVIKGEWSDSSTLSFRRRRSDRLNQASLGNVDESLCCWRFADNECQRGRDEAPLWAPTPLI